jgi:hypothetical protein
VFLRQESRRGECDRAEIEVVKPLEDSRLPSLPCIAKWDGSTWSVLGSGTDGGVPALASYTHGLGSELFIGGNFGIAGERASSYIAAWSCSGSGQGVSFCSGDGSQGACPCGNQGSSGRGCQNSISTGGARLTGSGSASLASDTLSLNSSGELPSAFSLFLQGTTDLASPAAFGDGLRCAGGTLKRLYKRNASGGSVTAPSGADLPVHTRSAALGNPILAGQTRSYQVYYRDPNPAFCAEPIGSTFNASQALRILWVP